MTQGNVHIMDCHYVHALLHCLSFIDPIFIVKPNKMLITIIIIDYLLTYFLHGEESFLSS